MSVSKSTAVIQLSIVYIKDDDLIGLQKVLNVLPLDKLGDYSEKLLSNYLSVCAAYDRKEAVKIILKNWKVVYPPEEKMQILSRLFLIENINIETLSYVVLSNETFTYVELMDDLIEFDSSPQIITACQKADKIFGLQPYETYKIVQEHAYEIDNDNVYDYATDKMEETAPYAPSPTWVTGEPSMTEKELMNITVDQAINKLPSDNEAVEMLTKGLSHLGISVGELEEAKKFLLLKLSRSNHEEKLEMLKPIMENVNNLDLTKNITLFRIFGPANPLVDQDLTLETPSSKYGGCRMFLDQTFCYDEEFDYVKDWYDGVCSYCHLKIKYRWYALRKPRVHGGWENCYCSWKCVRDSVFWDGEEPNLLQHELINIFEKELNVTGIQDRKLDE